jgi:pSer/pThr/pTyr-binding forkhead associated (FHA) protein
MDGPSPAPLPAGTGGHTHDRTLEAVGFLKQCCLDQTPVAAIMGSDAGEISDVLNYFVAEIPANTRVARVLAPTDSPQAFLESILLAFGFHPEDLTTDDLQRLLLLVLCHGSKEEGGAMILVEDAQEFGPRVLEAIRDLIRNLPRLDKLPMIVLAGAPSLHQVLDSQGMLSIASLTRWRFDLDGRAPRQRTPSPDGTTTSAQDAAKAPMLVATLAGRQLGIFKLSERRLLIGRGALSDIRLESRFVSRHHALVMPADDGTWIVDLNSMNGTLVNSQPIRHRRLVHGDVIGIGDHRIHYHHSAAATRWSPPEAPAVGPDTFVMRSIREAMAG